MKRILTSLTLALCLHNTFAAEKVLNIFTWADEIPHEVIVQFEKETGIKVNQASFDTNEVMYTKLRAAKDAGYDLVEPSSYYIDRMHRLGLLQKLDKNKLPNLKNIDPFFLNQAFDPQSDYSIPFIWGVTGIFLNSDYFSADDVTQTSDLLKPHFKNQLMLLDDAREVFSMALRMLSYSINDSNPQHIREAYLKLKELLPNVRLFNSDAVASILIDEDATIGMAWNGDLFKAQRENSRLKFIYPKNGFEIWVDSFALLKDAPHPDNAYAFLNFLMRPDIAKTVSMRIGYSTANLAARKLMPADIRNSPILYPSVAILSQGEFETDIDDEALALYENYWEQLKMGG